MPLQKVPLQLSWRPVQVLEGCCELSLQTALPQPEQPNSLSLFLIGEVFPPLDHCCGPPLDLLQQLRVFSVLRAPELDAGLQVGSHQSGVKGQNHLPAGHASLHAAQARVAFLGCEHRLLGRVELLILQYTKVLLGRAALNPFSTQPVFVLGIALTHVQDLALGLVELHEVHMSPLFEPVRVPLDGIPCLQHVDCTTQLDVGKLAECALNPTVHVADKDINSVGPDIDP